MYRKEEQASPTPEKFELPFEGKLSPNNRWVIMAELIPWDDFEEEYAKLFSIEKGAPAKPFRIALGTLIIKEKLGTSDRETIEQIRENPYLQYFLGFKSYQDDPMVDSSMLVHFRKRIDGELVNEINQEIVKREKEKLDKEVKKKVYEQQRTMWENKTQSVPQRIVSLTQPHIRPIVRGKAGKQIEFGAKLSVSCVDNYVFLDKISWENFNESCHLKEQVEKYKETFGYYPESLHVDKIYRTRENRNWCKERGIRISGPKLGRPPKADATPRRRTAHLVAHQANVSEEEKKQARSDECLRNAIEGKFGQAKRRFNLNLVMTKLPETSITSIAITFLVVNLSRLLRQFLSLFLSLFTINRTQELIDQLFINCDYALNLFSVLKLINLSENSWSKVAEIFE